MEVLSALLPLCLRLWQARRHVGSMRGSPSRRAGGARAPLLPRTAGAARRTDPRRPPCAQALPEMLLPFLRLAHCADAGALRRGDAFAPAGIGAPRDSAVEGAALAQLVDHLRSRLARCAAGAALAPRDRVGQVSG